MRTNPFSPGRPHLGNRRIRTSLRCFVFRHPLEFRLLCVAPKLYLHARNLLAKQDQAKNR